MAVAAASTNKVLGITIQGYDQLSPAAKAALGGIKMLERGAVLAFKAITLPVRLLHSAITALLSPIGLLRSAIAFLVARGVVRVFAGAADDLDVIDKLNIKLGIGTRALQEYRIVADLANVSLESVSTSVVQMQNRIAEAARGSGEATKALRMLRLSAIELRQMRPEDQFLAIRDALSGVENHTERINLAMDLFGRQGAEMLKVFQMSREEWEQVRASMTIFTAEEIKRAAAFNDAITLLKRTWQDLRTIVAIEFFPFLQKGIDGLRDFIRKQLPELKNGARAVAQYLEFGTRSLIEFVKLWHHLLSDRDSTRALGEVMRLTGKLALDTAETALKGLIEIVIRAGSFLLVPLRELGIELGGELALGLVRGLAKLPAKLAGLAAEWTKALANKVGPLGPVGSAFRAMVNELAEIGSLQSTAVQMAIDQILPATPQQELIDRFGLAGQKAAKAFGNEWSKTVGMGGDLFRELNLNVTNFVEGLKRLAGDNKYVNDFIERIRALRHEIFGAKAAMEELEKSSVKAAATVANVFGEATIGFRESADEFIKKLTDVQSAAEAARKLGGDLFTNMAGAFEGAMDSMIDSAVRGSLNIRNAFKELGREVLAIIAKIIARLIALSVVQALFGGISIGGSSAPAAAAAAPYSSPGVIGSYGGAGYFARGAAFRSGQIIPFASGGIVNKPTFFPMKNGTGLMGEAGPEAIMPLARDRRGRLGVRADNQRESNVRVTINVQTIDAQSFDGYLQRSGKTIEGIIQNAIASKNDMRANLRQAVAGGA